jgi:hypothetical protein
MAGGHPLMERSAERTCVPQRDPHLHRFGQLLVQTGGIDGFPEAGQAFISVRCHCLKPRMALLTPQTVNAIVAKLQTAGAITRRPMRYTVVSCNLKLPRKDAGVSIWRESKFMRSNANSRRMLILKPCDTSGTGW